jgi:predicted RNase H-like nuclease (RuvC/YqgF family)
LIQNLLGMKAKLFGVIVCLGAVFSAFAQELSKEEKALLRQWEKRKKETTAEQFKALVESKEAKEKELQSLEAGIEGNERQISQKNAEIAQLRAKIKDLEQKRAEMNSQETDEIPSTPQKESPKKNQKKTENQSGTFQVQTECGGTVLVLGVFKSMAEAQKFQNTLKKIQITNSQIVRN